MKNNFDLHPENGQSSVIFPQNYLIPVKHERQEVLLEGGGQNSGISHHDRSKFWIQTWKIKIFSFSIVLPTQLAGLWLRSKIFFALNSAWMYDQLPYLNLETHVTPTITSFIPQIAKISKGLVLNLPSP